MFDSIVKALASVAGAAAFKASQAATMPASAVAPAKAKPEMDPSINFDPVDQLLNPLNLLNPQNSFVD